MRALALALAVAALVAACGTTEAPSRQPAGRLGRARAGRSRRRSTRPGASSSASLGERNLVLADSQAPVRPAEAPLLAARPAGRLPGHPAQGPDPRLHRRLRVPRRRPRRGRGGARSRRYLATGPGRVQTPAGDGHDHPPGRLDGRLLRLAAAAPPRIRRRPGSRRRSRRSGSGSRSRATRVGAGARRPAAACPPRPTRGPGRA